VILTFLNHWQFPRGRVIVRIRLIHIIYVLSHCSELSFEVLNPLAPLIIDLIDVLYVIVRVFKLFLQLMYASLNDNKVKKVFTIIPFIHRFRGDEGLYFLWAHWISVRHVPHSLGCSSSPRDSDRREKGKPPWGCMSCHPSSALTDMSTLTLYKERSSSCMPQTLVSNLWVQWWLSWARAETC
jgi:hypothetical protein